MSASMDGGDMSENDIDLKPWGYAPGGYSEKCIDCPPDLPWDKRLPMAKRAWRCKEHALAAMAKQFRENYEPTLSQPSLPPHESGLDDDDREIGEPVEIVNLRPWSPHESAGEPDQQLLDDLSDIIQPIHWETWKAALFCDHADGWPDEDEQEFIARRVDDIAVLEHWDAWGKEIVAKVAKLVIARTPDLQAENARLRGALEATEGVLRDFACHGATNGPCRRTPEQCSSQCGLEAGNALICVLEALSTKGEG